ncbi:MAG TPA: Npun_R1517 family heterocyst differentiation transcriptional regulator [Leptolyngbyaceae cyanobacterium M65_K2018_010]|nr:Npun_R1517 family heterocyst differentiation transcriptional regulator [Leptolyngbyaceae cyanobacterium M65_K2018_010]
MTKSLSKSSDPSQVGVYECEITLKFRLLEESGVIGTEKRERLLELLLDAYSYGNDEFIEALESQLQVNEISEVDASPLMRRQLIRLRNRPQD